MSEEAQPSVEQEVAAPKTLDDVFSEFNVEAPTQEQVVEQAPTPIQYTPIDPYDESQLNQFAADTRNQQVELQTKISSLEAAAKSRDDAIAAQAMEKDIKQAVSAITEKVEGIDPDIAELYLEKQVRASEKLTSVWQNRGKNPDALSAALDVIAHDLNSKHSFKADPQIAENHRAATQSLQSNQTQKASEYGSPLEEQLANAKSEGERQVIWQNAKNLGY